MQSLKINSSDMKYRTMIGTGGIGSGKFFLLDGNHTMGREESRSGHYLETRDYCKLHIISHYVRVLTGPDFEVTPIGKVGEDEAGKELLKEMRDVGMSCNYLKSADNSPTLFSFCFVYPDGSGGNMTTNNSACAGVRNKEIQESVREFKRFEGNGIALAVPEVPMEARKSLLELASNYDFFRVASFTSEEIPQAVSSGLLKKVDLLAINLDEAASAVDLSVEESAESIVQAVVELFRSINPGLWISITNGKEGSWTWNGKSLAHVPIYEVSVESTAGAGDAHIAGMITGLTAGLDLYEAQQLGSLVSAHAVTSPHTINKETNRMSLLALIEHSKSPINKNILNLLKK